MATRTDIKPCDVFVSWTGKDRALKDRIVEYLEGRGLSCIDSDSACAGDFTRWSREAVSFGTVFLPIITENTAESRYMPMEAEEAKKLDDAVNRILPVATSYEVYTANGFDFHVSESAVIFGEAFSDERLAELYEKVVSLINNRAFQAYTHSKSYIKLALLYREKQTGKDLSLDYDAIYLPRRVKDEVEGDGACPFDEALMAGREVLYLHGPAGCGKSQYINEIKKKLPEEYLTIALSCAKVELSEQAVDRLLYEEFCRLAGTRVYSPAVFTGLLQSKHLVLVLDGLDEIPTEAGTRRFVEKVEAFYLPRKEKITLLFTGRNPDDVKHLALGEEKVHSYLLEKLTEEEIRCLSERIFLSFGQKEKGEAFYLQIKSLEDEIKSNPLLLSQLTVVYEKTGDVPKTVVGILDAVSKITFRVDDERAWNSIPSEYHTMLKNIPDLLKRFSFERYQLQSKGKVATTGKILKHILKASYADSEARARVLEEYLASRAILVDDEFAHKMFLEYFTAVSYYEYIFDDYDELEDLERLRELFSHYSDPYWSAVLKLFLVKADSEIDRESAKALYRAIVTSADIREYTLLFDTCRDLIRHKKEAETELLGDILHKSVEGIYPPYGPLFYYVPVYELYAPLASALAENVSAEGLALVRDVCWIYGCYNTLAEIIGKDGGREIFEKGKHGLKGVRTGLCELFYLGKTDGVAQDGEVFPRCFSLSEAKSFLETGCGVMAPVGDRFVDEMGLFSMDMLNELNGEWIGLMASREPDLQLQSSVYTRSGLKVTGWVWDAKIGKRSDIPYYRRLRAAYFSASIPCYSQTALKRQWWRHESCLQYFDGWVSVPMGVTQIGEDAFKGCTALREVRLPEGLTEIKSGAFYGCRGLRKITLPESLSAIGELAFCYCGGLSEISLPDGLQKIGMQAFYGCESLFWIHIPEGISMIDERTFSGCRSLTEVRLPESLTLICEGAFSDCVSLPDIRIPDGVSEIEMYAFTSCEGLKEISLPDGVTEIEYHTFYACKALSRIKLPKGLTKIGEGAFRGCTDLCQVYLPEGLLEIGDIAFFRCTHLAEVVFPDSLLKIGGHAFYGCTDLCRVNLPKGLSEIAGRAFSGCTGLREVRFPDDLRRIEAHAFLNCTSLCEVVLPKGLLHVGAFAFFGCTGLSKVYIPESVAELGTGAFSACRELKQVIVSPYLYRELARGGIGEDVTLTFHEEMKLCRDEVVVGEGSDTAPGDAFQNDLSLIRVRIADGVQRITPKAFFGCKNLQEVYIPDSVTEIGEGAFEECKSLVTLQLPKDLLEISDSLLSGCVDLVTVNIPEGVSEIGEGAFYGCKKLAEILIPDSVKRIGPLAFRGCAALSEVSVPEGVEELGRSVFGACYHLARVELPQSVRRIGKWAFGGCYRLESICLPEKLTALGESAFADSGLVEIRLPAGIEEVEAFTFSDCRSLVSVDIPKGVTSLGSCAFENCVSLTEVTLPDGVTAIKEILFRGCKGLKTVHIPTGVTEIGWEAFKNCESLSSVYLPEGLVTIEREAFQNCRSLREIEIPRSVTAIRRSAFRGCVGLKRIRIGYRFEGEIERIFGDIDRTIVEFY